MTAPAENISAPPFILEMPDIVSTPVVFSSPHSGCDYPQELLDATPLKRAKLRSLEDCYVDELFDHVTAQGSPFIKATYPRAWIDLNREPYELDPKLISPKVPTYANSKTLRVKGGLGTLPRIVADGSAIYRQPIMLPDALARIDTVHTPYHEQLGKLTSQAKSDFGLALLLDCHSMPSSNSLYQGGTTSDIVIGNRYNASCDPKLARVIAECFTSHGFTVTFNRPYAGGYITENHGRPMNNIHALQIEINRRLYLDQITLEKTAEFRDLKQRLCDCTALIIEKLNPVSSVPLAAE